MPTGDRRKAVGARGEEIVRNHVAGLGWEIVDHNVRWREGELDLIAIDAGSLVFGEVKTLVARAGRRNSDFSPFESIDARKQVQVRALARRWLVDELRRVRGGGSGRIDTIRFDAFAVTLSRAGELVELEHLEDAF